MIRKAMGMIPCEEAMARLWEFLDGELLPEDETAVKWHLDVCSRCFPQYDFQRAYFEYTGHIREREYASIPFRRRLFEKILEQEGSDRSPA